MADLYRQTAGALIKTSEVSPAFLMVDGLPELRSDFLLATRFGIVRAQATQYVKSLSNLIYIYAFGEIPGKIDIGGIALFRTCSAQTDAIRFLNDYYSENNIYNRDSAIRITIGGAAFSVFLEQMAITGEQNPFNIASFQMQFTFVGKSQSRLL